MTACDVIESRRPRAGVPRRLRNAYGAMRQSSPLDPGDQAPKPMRQLLVSAAAIDDAKMISLRVRENDEIFTRLWPSDNGGAKTD